VVVESESVILVGMWKCLERKKTERDIEIQRSQKFAHSNFQTFVEKKLSKTCFTLEHLMVIILWKMSPNACFIVDHFYARQTVHYLLRWLQDVISSLSFKVVTRCD